MEKSVIYLELLLDFYSAPNQLFRSSDFANSVFIRTVPN